MESGGGSGRDHGQPIEVAVVGVGYWGPKLVRNFVVPCAADTEFSARYLAW